LASLLYGPVRKRNKDLVELVVFVRRHRRAVGQRCIVSWLMRSRVHSRGGDGPSRGALYAPRPSKICLVRHRGALRGTPGSACSQLGPNATKLPICAPVLASRELRKDGGDGGGGVARRARAAAPRPVASPPQRPASRPSRARPSRAPQGQRGGQHACVGRGFRCWKMARLCDSSR